MKTKERLNRKPMGVRGFTKNRRYLVYRYGYIRDVDVLMKKIATAYRLKSL